MKPLVILVYLAVSCSVLADDVERRYGLPDGLLDRMQWHESRGGTGTHFVSDVVNAQQLRYLQKIANGLPRTPAHRIRGNYYGAMGVMQIIPSTFYTFAQDGDGDGVKDPMNYHDNRATAAYYLAWLYGKYGSWRTALRKYTGGARYAEKILASLSP